MGGPPTAVPVDLTECGGVDRDGEAAARPGQQSALRVDDLASRCRQVDEPECLALRREGEVRPADDLQRPEAERQEAEEGDRGEPDDPDADEEARAAVEVCGSDGNRADAETARDTDAATAAPGVRDEIAQRTRSGSASGTSRPLRRTTWGTLCPVGTGAIAVRGTKDARFANVMPAELCLMRCSV